MWIVPFTWPGHWFWQRIVPFTWLYALTWTQIFPSSWFGHTDFVYWFFSCEMGLTAGVAYQQLMLIPPRHLIPPLVYPEVRVCLFLGFVFPVGVTRLITVCYLCYFIQNSEVNNVWNVTIIQKANTERLS
jgi:hypothetical protein